jgi:hypothetical protein
VTKITSIVVIFALGCCMLTAPIALIDHPLSWMDFPLWGVGGRGVLSVLPTCASGEPAPTGPLERACLEIHF